MTDETTTPWPEGILGADHAGVRVFWIATQTMQELVDRLALILGEHMSDTDELKVTYNAMQSGWHEHPGHDATLFPLRRAQAPWTELQFEYSAFVVLRNRVYRPTDDDE